MNATCSRVPDPQDTIAAVSSASGAGGRAILRLSGPNALGVATAHFTSSEPIRPNHRGWYTGTLQFAEVAAPLPVDLHYWPGPRSYTGQHLAELHTVSSPPLVDLVLSRLLAAGARAAQPGEFTLRAFLAGKLDLPRAEAVLGVIEAGSRAELKHALQQLAGGVTQPLHGLRDDLLNLLADVEAALDFADEDIRFIGERELLLRLANGMALLTNLRRHLEQRAVSGRTFRAVLAGRPNAGKSSLFNALIGEFYALVSPQPGTTRDYLTRSLQLGSVTVELVDTAGLQTATDTVESQAQFLGRDQTGEADLVLLCVEAGSPVDEEERALLTRSTTVRVATKCDLAAPSPDWIATSARAGTGLTKLHELLASHAQSHRSNVLAPSLSRCRNHVENCLRHMQQAHHAVLFQEPPELIALALREALDDLGALVGAVYTDDLLDRIFTRFCIGK